MTDALEPLQQQQQQRQQDYQSVTSDAHTHAQGHEAIITIITATASEYPGGTPGIVVAVIVNI